MSDKVRTPARGDDVFLSPEENAFVQRILSRPESFPQAFWSAVIQKVALDGQPIPQSQISGSRRIPVSPATTINTPESTTSTTYTNLATVGPTIEGLSNGTYFLLFSASMAISGAVDFCFMAVMANATAIPNDNDAVATSSTAAFTHTGFAVVVLDANNNNTLTVKYRTNSGTSLFSSRRMIALKIGN